MDWVSFTMMLLKLLTCIRRYREWGVYPSIYLFPTRDLWFKNNEIRFPGTSAFKSFREVVGDRHDDYFQVAGGPRYM